VHHLLAKVALFNKVQLCQSMFPVRYLSESIAGKLLSAVLQFVSLAATFVVRFKTIISGAHLSVRQFVSLSASCWLGARQSAMLNTVTLFAALPCTLSVQLQSVSSAVLNTVYYVSSMAVQLQCVNSAAPC